MITLNSLYDKIICISLKERDDKYQFMSEQFKLYSIDAEFYRPVINGFNSKIVPSIIKEKTGHFNQGHFNEFGTSLSFYHVIKTALLDGVEQLFIFEDDFKMKNDWHESLPKYLNTIPKDADGIMLYSYMTELHSKNTRVNSKWIKAFNSWSHIAIGMNRKFMQEYINQQDMFFRIADLVTYQLQEKFNLYVAIPPLGIPSNLFDSNIRTLKNYEINKSILLMGINDNIYL